MACTCPACRGLNDERYEDYEVEMQQVEVEVTFKERVKLTIPVYEHDQEEIDYIHQEVEKLYVDVEVVDWKEIIYVDVEVVDREVI